MLILIASYPKSGNTWVRAILDALWQRDHGVHINDMRASVHVASRHWLDEHLGVGTSDLTDIEALRARRELLKQLSLDQSIKMSLKSHDAWIAGIDGFPFADTASIGLCLHIVRDPRDVAISGASFFDVSIDTMIERMANNTYVVANPAGGIRNQLPQHYCGWSSHTASYLDAERLCVHTMRYEDMLADPRAAIARIARLAGLEADDSIIEKVTMATSFKALRSQEERHGFREMARDGSMFFRSGISGGWRGALTAAQAARVERDHARIMARLGYA